MNEAWHNAFDAGTYDLDLFFGAALYNNYGTVQNGSFSNTPVKTITIGTRQQPITVSAVTAIKTGSFSNCPGITTITAYYAKNSVSSEALLANLMSGLDPDKKETVQIDCIGV